MRIGDFITSPAEMVSLGSISPQTATRWSWSFASWTLLVLFHRFWILRTKISNVTFMNWAALIHSCRGRSPCRRGVGSSGPTVTMTSREVQTCLPSVVTDNVTSCMFWNWTMKEWTTIELRVVGRSSVVCVLELYSVPKDVFVLQIHSFQSDIPCSYIIT
jgi:hypothetical protein